MLPRRMCLFALLVLSAPAVARGDGRPLREASSANREYVLRIEPGRLARADAPCMATMLRATGRDASPRPLWKRPLVNDTAPGQVFIRNDGKFTVTLDEHGRGGARHALVIYGEDGRLLRHHIITDLLSKDDWRHVRISKRSLDWLDGARCRFDTPRNIFLIELEWGRSVVLDLQTLQIVRSTTDVPTGLLLDVPPQVVELLESSAALGDNDLGEEAATTQPGTGEPVTGESAPRGTHGDSEATAPESAPADSAGVPQPGPEIGGVPPDAGELAPGVDPAPAGPEPGLPPPNPAAPSDYVAWLNQFGVCAPDQDARPLYDAAIRSFVPFEGDQSLLGNALNGDPEALASPQLAVWLDANRAALDTFRRGAMLDHRSWALHSPDGSMMSVLLPDLSPMRQLARASILEGRRLAAAGRTAEAADRILDALAAGAHVGSGATLIENLVGTAMQTQGADALLDLQASAPEGALDYARLAREAEAAARPVAPYGDVLMGERLFALDALQRMYVPGENGGYVPDRRKIAAFAGLVGSEREAEAEAALEAWMPTDKSGFDAVVADFNAYFDRASEAVNSSYLAGRPQLEALDRSIPARHETNPLLAQLAPNLSRAHLVRTRGEATRRAAVLVASLNAYRQAHGEYPDSLDAFAGRDFAVDPFTGGAFIYRREGGSFRLYSAAANGVDDGGVHDPKAESGDVLYWPRPPRP